MIGAAEEQPIHSPEPAKARHDRNLLILHTPTLQDISDWTTVQGKVMERAPDIEVRIASNSEPDPAVREWQITRPSVVFSPFRLLNYQPLGGTIYAGRLIGKIAETWRMAEHGLPVPRTAILTTDLTVDPGEWGEYVIVKPVFGVLGRHVSLVRTDQLSMRFGELSSGGTLRLLVQRFVDHVDNAGHLRSYRVLTMSGEPLYASERTSRAPRLPLAEIAADPAGAIASNAQGSRTTGKLTWDTDVLALARQVAKAFPRIPCLAQDIIRERTSGKLFILETNPQGYSWHLSSDFSRAYSQDEEWTRSKYEQFGALDVVADKLIEKTRRDAS